jgi:iron(III) transport system substrate-binding protein
MPAIAIRTIQEMSAGRKPSSDINLGAETTIAILLRSKALMPVNWSDYWPEITKEMQTANGTAVHVATLYAGIHYNTNLIKPDQVPRKLADVFRQEWKGKIASTPYAAGFDRLALSRGGDAVRPIVAKASEWVGGLIRCGENERIASGEFILLFLDCGRTDNTLLTENGGPVGQVVLEDAALTTNWFFGVPRTSARPNLAILLAGYLATADGQMVLEEIAGTASHRTPGTQAYKIGKDLEARGAEVLNQTPDQLLDMSKEMEAYRKEFQAALRKR